MGSFSYLQRKQREESQLILGDSFKILTKMKPESADMIFADPPYFLNNNPFIRESLCHFIPCHTIIHLMYCITFYIIMKGNRYSIYISLYALFLIISIDFCTKKEESTTPSPCLYYSASSLSGVSSPRRFSQSSFCFFSFSSKSPNSRSLSSFVTVV